MLLVTFHGGNSGINNIYAYDTTTNELINQAALAPPTSGALSELRDIVSANGQLFVVSGAKATSQIFCYYLPNSSGACAFVSLVIGPSLSKNKRYFETAIAHPFGITFNDSSTCYISNQDTNVVAQVQLTNNVGSLGKGCQSDYLNGLFPSPAVFLDGTFVASEKGKLHKVKITAPNVPATDGGLGVTIATSGSKQGEVTNSVRGVAVAGGILFVCDEVNKQIKLYALADGSFLGSSTVKNSPTHLVIQNSGLWVSAGDLLYWGQLPTSTTAPAISLEPLAITPPTGNKIGGISFNGQIVYIPFQDGTGSSASGGSIVTYLVTQGSDTTLPQLSNSRTFQSKLTDTPEFVLFVA